MVCDTGMGSFRMQMEGFMKAAGSMGLWKGKGNCTIRMGILHMRDSGRITRLTGRVKCLMRSLWSLLRSLTTKTLITCRTVGSDMRETLSTISKKAKVRIT